MQIPIINGIYTDASADFRTSYPRNLIPVPKTQGISKGYLRPADGITSFGGATPGADRGGINWNGACYRVSGSKLVRVDSDGSITIIGDVGLGNDNAKVTFDYSFDRLAVCSANNLYYCSGSALSRVTDGDLGNVIDFIWVDGYFMATDGTYIVVTDLSDPLQVNPLKYGSAETDPDSIVAIVKLHNEPHAIGRYTIQAFRNVGGQYFPFQYIQGSEIMRGAVGTHAVCVFAEQIAFVGSAKNEPCAVWVGSSGTSVKISTREIDTILQEYSEADLAKIVAETRIDKGHQFLYLHLPDQTLVYDAAGSSVVGEPVWFVLTTSIEGTGTYRARNFVWCYDKWIVGDPIANRLGTFTNKVSSHYGAINGWDFTTLIIYNNTNGVIFHELELVCLTGNSVYPAESFVFTSYSTDGVTWSNEQPRRAGRAGQRTQRINWLQQGNMLNWRIQRFRGTSDAHISVAALEARLEQLNV